MRLCVLTIALILRAAILAAAPVVPNPVPMADELFERFVEQRTHAASNRLDNAEYYSRKWLEDALTSASSSFDTPAKPGLNWVQDALLARMSITSTVDRVYSYELKAADAGQASLQMHVLRCNRPFTFTLTYVFELGRWRIAKAHYDSTDGAQRWYSADFSKPIREFTLIQARDRSRYFNESPLGQSLGLEVSPKDCPQ